MDAAKPSPAPIRARRWLRATHMPAPSSTTVRIGSTILRAFSARYPLWALTRYLAEKRATVGWIWGIWLTSVNPRALSRDLTSSMRGPRSATTSPLRTLTLLPPRPDSAFTSSSWTVRFSWGHSRATRGPATTLATWLWMNPSTPLASDPDAPCSSVATRDRPSLVSSPLTWSARACTLSWLVISVVILSVRKRWMAGSWMSGSMLATKRSVLETWLAVHTATTDSGANTHPKTMRTTATGVRQLNRRPGADRPVGPSGWPVSSRGAGASVVMVFPPLWRTAGRSPRTMCHQCITAPGWPHPPGGMSYHAAIGHVQRQVHGEFMPSG